MKVIKKKQQIADNLRLFKLVTKNQEEYPGIGKLTLFFILSNDNVLYEKSSQIYDFQNHNVNVECLNTLKLDKSRKMLLEAGFNLCFGYKAKLHSTFTLTTELECEMFNLYIQTMMFYKNYIT